MKFKKRLSAYGKLSFTFSDKLNLLLFTLIRNRPLKKDGLLNKFFRYLKLRVHVLNGKSFVIDTSAFSQFVIIDEFLIDPIYDLKRIPFDPDRILDCGAHVGYFSILASSFFTKSKIFSFEPLPANILMFKKQMEINHIDNVELIEAAVSNANDKAFFEVAVSSFGGNLVNEVKSEHVIEVLVKDLKPYIFPNEKLLLKMDIEGEEEKLFPSILPILPTTCAIFFESHSIAGKESILNLLHANSFHVTTIRTVGNYADHFALRG